MGLAEMRTYGARVLSAPAAGQTGGGAGAGARATGPSAQPQDRSCAASPALEARGACRWGRAGNSAEISLVQVKKLTVTSALRRGGMWA